MKLNKHLIIGIVVILIIGVALFLLNISGVVTLYPKIEKLKEENQLLQKNLTKQKTITDSLLHETDVLTNEWESRDTMMKANIEIKYYERSNNIYNLDDDSTVLLLSEWLSEIDSLQR